MPASPSEKPSDFSDPIPTKFLLEDEFLALKEAVDDTGLSRSEIVRRAVRLLRNTKKSIGNYRFVLDLKPST